MPFLLAEILNFQGSTHHIGVGSFSGLLTNFKAKNATAPAASRFHYAAGEMAGFYCALITLLDKAYMLADLFVNFFFPFIKYNLIFLKQVSSLCINGYDQWSEFLNTAVP